VIVVDIDIVKFYIGDFGVVGIVNFMMVGL